MDFKKQENSIDEIREMDMVGYLSGLGHEPVRIRKVDHWYLSPLREEKTASFKINRKLNRWYDYGIGKGGNIIDFAILYHNCTVGEFLRKLNGDLKLSIPKFQPHQEQTAEDKVKVIQHLKIQSFSLVRYLEQRRIPREIADQYCGEIRYQINDETYFGLSFKNDSGGYEIRNPYFKGSNSPKDITTSRNGSNAVLVFEGFIDFLSFITIYPNQSLKDNDFVILNSISFFEKARPFMEQHQAVHLYLDRDIAGQSHSIKALALNNKYKDESHLYEGHKDINEWLMSLPRFPGQKLKIKLRY